MPCPVLKHRYVGSKSVSEASVALLPTAIWHGVVVPLVCCELLLRLLPCLLQDHVCCKQQVKLLASGEEGCSGLFEWEHSQGNQAGCVLPPIGQHQVQHGPMLQSDGVILEHLAGSLHACKEWPHVSNSDDRSIGGPDRVEATIG